jgi:protein SCO1
MASRLSARRGAALVPALAVAAGLALAAAGPPASAHDSRQHAAPVPQAAPPTATATGLPFDLDIGAGFSGLLDAAGRTRSLADFRGRYVLVFFGYANCEAICSAALPDMARTSELVDAPGERLTAIMITVDPERDTPAAMGGALARIDPRLYGLTGSPAALAAAREAFRVETGKVGTDWLGKPIYSHGTYLYLIGPDGRLRTLLPPILGPQEMARIIRTYF